MSRLFLSAYDTVQIVVWNCAMDETQAVTDTLDVEVMALDISYQIYLPIVLRSD